MEITAGSAVIVMCTYNLSDGTAMSYGVNIGISLNVQSIILLADPLKTNAQITSKISSNAPLHLSVLSETESSNSEDQMQDIDNEPESQLMELSNNFNFHHHVLSRSALTIACSLVILYLKLVYILAYLLFLYIVSHRTLSQ